MNFFAQQPYFNIEKKEAENFPSIEAYIITFRPSNIIIFEKLYHKSCYIYCIYIEYTCLFISNHIKILVLRYIIHPLKPSDNFQNNQQCQTNFANLLLDTQTVKGPV